MYSFDSNRHVLSEKPFQHFTLGAFKNILAVVAFFI
jgi:hypothetical protein